MTYLSAMIGTLFSPRTLRWPALAVAGFLLVASVGQAVAHCSDLSGVEHIVGIWVALAQYCNAGVLYPPLQADGYFAGTRYMPVLFGAIAGVERAVGDYLLAAKLLALASTALLLAGVFVVTRRVTGRSAEAVALAGMVLALPEGRSALLSPHADALAAALGVWGLLLIDPQRFRPGRTCLAAALFVLALLTKFSSVAAPAAAAVVLARAGRRQFLTFTAAYLALALAGLLSVQWLSEGRFLENMRGLASGGMTLESLRIGPARVVAALRQTPWVGLVLPLALLASLWAREEGRFGVWDWYLLFTAATVLPIFTSPGTGPNHLLELEAAAVLAIASALVPRPAGSRELLVRVASVAVLLAGASEAVAAWGAPGADAVPVRAVAEALPPGGRLLAEDSTIPVALGQRPVVMDAFSFRLLAERGRVEDGELVRALHRQEFDALVLLGRIDRPGESLCPHFHFGPRVTEAMREEYRFERRVGIYCVFVPRGR